MSVLTSPQRRLISESDFERRRQERRARQEQGDLGAQVRADTETGRQTGETFSIFRSPGGTFRLVPSGQPTEIGSFEIVSGIPITDRQLAIELLPRLRQTKPEASTFQQDIKAGRSQPIWVHKTGCPVCGKPLLPSVTRLAAEKCPLTKILGISYLAHFTARNWGFELAQWRRFPWGQALWDLVQKLEPIGWDQLRPLIIKNSS